MRSRRQEASEEAATEFLARFRGSVVSSVWFSDHRVMYLEVGNRLPAQQAENHPKHEKHIFPGYNWIIRQSVGDPIERRHSGSDRLAEDLLVDRQVASVLVSGAFELVVHLDSGTIIESVSDREEDPDWDLRDGHEYLGVSAGSFQFETGRP